MLVLVKTLMKEIQKEEQPELSLKPKCCTVVVSGPTNSRLTPD